LFAGQTNQATGAISIGAYAGNNNCGVYSVNIGYQSAQAGQGANAIAIGYLAGQTNQPANSICISASGSATVPLNGSSCVINPVRQVQSTSTPSVPFSPSANNALVYYPTGLEVIRNPCTSFTVRLQGYTFGNTINGISTSAWTCNTSPQATFDSAYSNGLYNGKLSTNCYHVLNCGSSSLSNGSIGYMVVPQTGIYNVSLSFGQSLATSAGTRIVIGLNNNGVLTEVIDFTTSSTYLLDQVSWSESMQLIGGWYIFPYLVTTPSFAVGNWSCVLLVPTY